MKTISQIMFEGNSDKALVRAKEHLEKRIAYYRKNNVPEISNLIKERFLSDSLFVVPFEDKEKIYLVSYGSHEIILKDFTQAIIKVIELSGLCYPGVCKNFTDILKLLKDRLRMIETEETLSAIETFLFNVIYQLERTTEISCSIQVEYLIGGFKAS